MVLVFESRSEYFGIGEEKIKQIVSDNIDAGFVIQNGVKCLIKSKRFEDFLEEMAAI